MLTIKIWKQADGAVTMRCIRQDGSVTWQKQTRHAAHFVIHDVTHYAVETTLGSRLGFFGLIADGWDIDDTTGRGSRGPLPPEALEVEQIVGLFDAERTSGVLWRIAEFNEYTPRAITESEFQTVRRLRGELMERWREIQPGENLELIFQCGSAQV